MFPIFHAQQARSRRADTPSLPAPAAMCVMHLTVDTGAVTALRQLVMRACGAALEFMRIAACAHGSRMKVWLCVSKPAVALVMEAVMRALPDAQFGRFSAPPPARFARRGRQ